MADSTQTSHGATEPAGPEPRKTSDDAPEAPSERPEEKPGDAAQDADGTASDADDTEAEVDGAASDVSEENPDDAEPDAAGKEPGKARKRWGGFRRRRRDAEPDDAEPGTDEQTEVESGPDAGDDESGSGEGNDEAGPDEKTGDEAGADEKPDTTAEPGPIAGDDDADPNELPYPTRTGWVVAAFLLFWPLAIPALVHSMRTAEANGTGNVRRAKKSSVRTLDFSLGAVTVGVLAVVGLGIAAVAAPTYASSLPPGLVSTAKSFVPPALAGPLGITLPDDGPALTAPTSSPSPTVDPYATTDPYADPYAEDPADGLEPLPTQEAGGQVAPSEEPTPDADTSATAGAEIPDLQVGDCIDTAATSGQTTLYRIPVVPCTTAHGGEIYAETTAEDSLAKNGEAPTQQALWDAADAFCYPQFTKYVGLQWAQSELLYWPIAPSEESWAEGDRRILCVVESEQPVTGSLEGAAR
ncbi:septum formation family protein [Promicromonospora sukumoe]|uniref:septum formation family protein n=1 Tax=Promicromonospora sukumoe TaxID=88382 RepID=UPI000372A956|nr:septum formation family protein [Promicromonospora sukumoe]